MEERSSVNMSLYNGYAVIAGLAGVLSGQNLFRSALNAIGYAQTSSNMAVREYYVNALVGLLLLFGGAALIASIYGLLKEEEWGRKTGFYASIASAVGWFCILAKIPALAQFGSFGFKFNRSAMFSNPSSPMVGIITSVPVLLVLVAVAVFFAYSFRGKVQGDSEE